MEGNFLTVGGALSAASSFLLTVFWYYVKGLSDKFREAEKDRAAIRQELTRVQLAYNTKDEARQLQHDVMELLREIKGDLKEVNSKLDRKADK